MPAQDPIHKRLNAFRQLPRMQAGSLIISVFGDAIYPRAGVVWLGCIIRLLEPLGLNERLIRTAIFRLVKEDWLQTQTAGRRTDYGLSETGRQRIDDASNLIYGGSQLKWDGQWRIILTGGQYSPHARTTLRKALYWHGFGEWNNHTFLHPSADLNQVVDSLHAEGLGSMVDGLLTLKSELIPTDATISHKEVVEQAWDLNHLGESYILFMKQYDSVASRLAKTAIDGETAFLTRLLLVHDYRRLLLRDPVLPNSLWPANWPGLNARQLFNHLYVQLAEPSESHLDSHLHRADQSALRRGPIMSKRIAAMLAGSES